MKQSRYALRDMVVLSLLIGLNVVLTRIASIRIPIGGVESLRIGFGAVPVIFAGLFFGPRAGAVVGALGDVAGFIMSPAGGAFMPHFTLTAALTGAIPPLALRLFRHREHVAEHSFIELLVAIAAGVGVRGALSNSIEGWVKANYVDGGAYEGDAVGTLGMHIVLNDTWGLVGELDAGGDVSRFNIGVRASF